MNAIEILNKVISLMFVAKKLVKFKILNEKYLNKFL